MLRNVLTVTDASDSGTLRTEWFLKVSVALVLTSKLSCKWKVYKNSCVSINLELYWVAEYL